MGYNSQKYTHGKLRGTELPCLWQTIAIIQASGTCFCKRLCKKRFCKLSRETKTVARHHVFRIRYWQIQFQRLHDILQGGHDIFTFDGAHSTTVKGAIPSSTFSLAQKLSLQEALELVGVSETAHINLRLSNMPIENLSFIDSFLIKSSI